MAKARPISDEKKRRPIIRERPAPLAYRINDAADAIGVGRTKLYELIAEGKIIAKKRDGLTFIRAIDLNAYLADADDTNEAQASIKCRRFARASPRR